jgi:hypothetical protein
MPEEPTTGIAAAIETVRRPVRPAILDRHYLTGPVGRQTRSSPKRRTHPVSA